MYVRSEQPGSSMEGRLVGAQYFSHHASDFRCTKQAQCLWRAHKRPQAVSADAPLAQDCNVLCLACSACAGPFMCGDRYASRGAPAALPAGWSRAAGSRFARCSCSARLTLSACSTVLPFASGPAARACAGICSCPTPSSAPISAAAAAAMAGTSGAVVLAPPLRRSTPSACWSRHLHA